MRAGLLSSIYYLYSLPTQSGNSWTTTKGQPTLIGRVDGYTRQASANEKVAAGIVDGTQTSVITVHSGHRITRDHMLRDLDGVDYNIVSVTNNVDGESELTVKESIKRNG